MTASDIRLAPGYHLYDTLTDGWRLAEPGEAFQRLQGPASSLAAIADAVRAGTDAGRLSIIGDDAAALAEALTARGALRSRSTTHSAPADVPRIAILGSGPVVHGLRVLLGLGSDIAIVDDPMTADAVVTIDPWYRDAYWSALATRGPALLRCHSDGAALYVGPFAAPSSGTDPEPENSSRTPLPTSYADYRGRRRAASPLIAELDALWAHLDTLPAAPLDVAAGVAGIAAGFLAADLGAWARGENVITATTELEIRSDGSVHAHPVLPLPLTASRSRGADA